MDILEEIAGIGSFDIDLVNNTWTASAYFRQMFKLAYRETYALEEFRSIIGSGHVLNQFEECLNVDSERFFECVCLTTDDQMINVECTVRMVRGVNGHPSHVLGVMRDISDRKAEEKRLSDIAALNAAKEETLVMAAHDLKSPINQISAVLNLLKTNPELDRNQFMELIERACGMAANIISDLVEAAEIHDGQFKLKKTRTDLNQIVRETATQFSRQAADKKISIRLNLCPDAAATVHPEKIARAIANLLSNALKFSEPHSEVNIDTAERIGDKLLIRIRDEGIGIRKENIPFIFDRFSNVRQQGSWGEKSSGLGLSIVKKIVLLHGGQIAVSSEENKGTEFTIQLPRNEA